MVLLMLSTVMKPKNKGNTAEAATADLRLIPAKLKHLGTEKCWKILKNERLS